MFTKRDKNEIRVIRHERVRKKISGTTESPRLCVFRSLKHIYAQLIDDTKGVTPLSAASWMSLTRRAPRSWSARPSLSVRSRRAIRPSCSTVAAMFTLAVYRQLLKALVKPDWSSDYGKQTEFSER